MTLEQNRPFISLRFSRDRRRLRTGLVVAILLVAFAAFMASIYMREQAHIRTEVITQNLAKSIEQGVNGMIDAIDNALLTSADEISRQQASRRLDRRVVTQFFEGQLSRVPDLSYLRATDEFGNVVYGQGILSPPNNISDREYFIRLRDDPKGDFLVSKHVVGRIVDKWVWLFVRRINKPDGSFGGVVFGGVLTEKSESQFSTIMLDTGGAIALRDGELGLIARYTPRATQSIPYGDKQLSAPFLDALNANPKKGTYVSGATSLDRISRTHSYRRSPKYGFVVNVGIAGDAALADWRTQTAVLIGLVTAFILASLTLYIFLARSWWRQEIGMVELIASQEALTDSEARFRSIFEDNGSVMLLIDPMNGKIIDANLAASDYYGYSRDLLVGMFINQINTQPAEMIATEMEQAAREKRNYFNLEHRLASGEVRDTEVYSTPIRVGGNAFLLSIIHDITARKRVQVALNESEERYRLLAENSIDVIWTLDIATRRFTYVSPAVEKLRGFTPEEVMAQPFEAALTPESVSLVNALVQAIQERIASGDHSDLNFVTEIEQPHRDGHIIPTEVVTSWILDEAGHPVSILGITRDITERKKAQELLENLAHTDSLTGLANRRYFMLMAEQELLRTRRYGGSLSVLMMDIDYFKNFNDTYGHQTGDLVLQKLGQICLSTLRSIDFVGRIGGEEFAVVLPQTDGLHAFEVAERLRHAVSLAEVVLERDLPIHFTLSIGVTTLGSSNVSIDTLLAQADNALYKAKHLGRNKISAFEDQFAS